MNFLFIFIFLIITSFYVKCLFPSLNLFYLKKSTLSKNETKRSNSISFSKSLPNISFTLHFKSTEYLINHLKSLIFDITYIRLTNRKPFKAFVRSLVIYPVPSYNSIFFCLIRRHRLKQACTS